ncbi:MAG TPA: ABC transporter ATP-binding protein [Thermoleophilaceae bacterium]|nr:ABC transporter ATP-binding protein [Thermoleophilaceae bacterium]
MEQAPAAVSVEHISKGFRLPHHRYTTLKERVLHPRAASTYDTLHALEDVSFEVKQGEFYGVVGRNGSGKSTLLKCLAGIYGIDTGDIALSGRLSPFIELGVGFNQELSARDNVIINAIMLGLTRREARERFDSIIAFAELEEFVDLKLKNYSSGMSVRLGFSTAIHVDADVLLVDEVLAVGDASFQAKCFGEFERLKREGKTILFVTHDMSAVERFCDRAMLLERGEIARIGPPDEVSKMYAELNFGRTVMAAEPEADDGAGTPTTRVVGSWCEDAAGERIVSIEQGNACRACFEVVFDTEVPNPVFAVAFRNEVRHTIFVATSAKHGYRETFEPGDRVIVRFEFANWLAPSRYTLTPSVSEGRPPVEIVRADDAATIIVEASYATGSVVDMPTELEVERL